jgi:hypothetical protein
MTAKRPRVDSDVYAEVELAAHPNSGSFYFIEGTSPGQMASTLFGLACFLLMHTYASLRCPPSFGSKSEFYQMNESEGNATVDIDITLSQLVESHRFVQLNASFITNPEQEDRTTSIDSTVRSNFMAGGTMLRTEHPAREIYQIIFTQGADRSSSFPVGHFRVDAIDSIQIRIAIQANFRGVRGVEFTWFFANPSAEKYARSSRMLLSFLNGYMLVLFAFYLRFDSESFTQVFLLIIGITGVFASNPITFFFPRIPGAKISDHVLTAIFLAIYKMFLILELEMLRSRNPKPKTAVVICLGIAFAVYATVDAAAGYDRECHIDTAEVESPIVLQTEIALGCLHALYSVCVLIYAVVAVVGNDGNNARRVGYFAFSAVLATCGSLFTGVYCLWADLWMYTVRRDLFLQAIIGTLAGMTLFFLHSGGGPEYVGLDDKLKETDQTVIEIDQISADGDERNQGEEEDDDEEEEEEEEE